MLNAAGDGGWELVAITGNWIVYMKRQIEDLADAPDAPRSARLGRRKVAPRAE